MLSAAKPWFTSLCVAPQLCGFKVPGSQLVKGGEWTVGQQPAVSTQICPDIPHLFLKPQEELVERPPSLTERKRCKILLHYAAGGWRKKNKTKHCHENMLAHSCAQGWEHPHFAHDREPQISSEGCRKQCFSLEEECWKGWSILVRFSAHNVDALAVL